MATRKRYMVDQSDAAHWRVVPADGTGEDLTFAEAKAHVIRHAERVVAHYRDQIARTRALRVADVEDADW